MRHGHELPSKFLVGVCRNSVRELHPTLVSRMKTQYAESLVVEVDVCYKPLLKASELLLLLHRDDKPIGIPRSVWRRSGWSCRAVRSDGRLLHMSLRFGEPHKRVSCGPHATEEECGSSSVVPCPPPYSEETRKPSASSKRLSMMA
jgi:hypothetical protein